jgi:hypothetical protein
MGDLGHLKKVILDKLEVSPHPVLIDSIVDEYGCSQLQDGIKSEVLLSFIRVLNLRKIIHSIDEGPKL